MWKIEDSLWLLSALLALVLTGVLLRGWANRRARRAEACYPPEGKFETVNGVRLHYVRKGSGVPVVLLHGSDGFLQDFARVLAASDPAAFDLIAFDRPGHGYSEASLHKGGTLSTQARLLRDAWRQLGIPRPLLVAHSWSAALALTCALEYPGDVGGLVLISPWTFATANPPPRLLYVARFFGATLAHLLLNLTPLKRWLVHESLKQAFGSAPIPADYERKARALWQRWPQQMAVFLQENVDAWRQFPTLSACYPALRIPTSLLTGSRDTVVSPEHHAHRLHREITSSELTVVLEAGHQLPHLRPELVLEAISRCAEQVSVTPDSPPPPVAATAVLERVREIVFRHGWNVTAYQLLNPELEHWFSPDGEAVVGYLRRGQIRVAAGAPLCAENRLAEVVALFEQDAAQHGERVCWFGAATRLREALAPGVPRASMIVGAQPVWNPTHWPELLKKSASLRAQINRSANKGIVVSEWSSERAAQSDDLQRCLENWLTAHPLPTLHFLTEPVTLDRLTDRRIFVAEQDGRAVAFLIATPVPSRNGWLIEQIARSSSAPNGTSEQMVDAAMRALGADGAEYVTLGLVPLTRRGKVAETHNPFWLRLTLAWIRAHGQRFYNFEGLDAFKAKFKPDRWEPIFAITNEPRISLRALLAMAAAFSEGPLLWTLAKALTSAAWLEMIWLWQRLSPKFRPNKAILNSSGLGKGNNRTL